MNTFWMKMCSLSERLKKTQNFHCPGSFRTKLLQYSLVEGGGEDTKKTNSWITSLRLSREQRKWLQSDVVK